MFVLVSQAMAVTLGTKWEQCIFYHGVELDRPSVCTKFVFVQ